MRRLPFGRWQIFRNGTQQIFRNHQQRGLHRGASDESVSGFDPMLHRRWSRQAPPQLCQPEFLALQQPLYDAPHRRDSFRMQEAQRLTERLL